MKKVYLATALTLLLLRLAAQDTLSFGSVALPEATVSARARAVSPLAQGFTVEEVRRLPATFYDPARLVALLPGTVQTNDQANHLSVRGNSPLRNQWRINGLVIANPNHTANAGTFYDFPTFNGGGVNAISAQLLQEGTFLAGGLPADYDGAPGGTTDLRLRPGTTGRPRYQLQASLLGFDAAAEAGFGRHEGRRYSILANARYSFTGLLAEAGVDFGGEAIAFSDLNLHLNKRTRRGNWGLFAISGRSSNRFTAPDPAEEAPEEQKDLYDIDFGSQLSILGAYYSSRGENGETRLGVSLSRADSERDQRLRAAPRRTAYDQEAGQGVLHLHYGYRRYLSDNSSLSVGLDLLTQEFSVDQGFREENRPLPTYVFTVKPTTLGAPVTFTRLYPAGSLSLGLRPGVALSGDGDPGFDAQPRLSATRRLGAAYRLLFVAEQVRALNWATAGPPPQANVLPRSYQGSLGLARGGAGLNWRTTAFYQRTPRELAARVGEFLYSSNNLLEVDPNLPLVTTTATRRYGLELEAAAGRRTTGWYWRGNLTTLRAESRQPAGSWVRDRWSIDYVAKVFLGREWTGSDRRQRTRTYGLNLALLAHAGERAGRVTAAPPPRPSVPGYFRPQNFRNGFTERNGTYFRPDLRLYRTRTSPDGRRTTTLALDVQNAAGVRNVQARYFDSLTGRAEERTSLGFIPVLSYRITFQ